MNFFLSYYEATFITQYMNEMKWINIINANKSND